MTLRERKKSAVTRAKGEGWEMKAEDGWIWSIYDVCIYGNITVNPINPCNKDGTNLTLL
jgi:hypothetical protein